MGEGAGRVQLCKASMMKSLLAKIFISPLATLSHRINYSPAHASLMTDLTFIPSHECALAPQD